MTERPAVASTRELRLEAGEDQVGFLRALLVTGEAAEKTSEDKDLIVMGLL